MRSKPTIIETSAAVYKFATSCHTMVKKKPEMLLILYILISVSSCINGQLHIICSATGDCIRDTSVQETSLSNMQHSLHSHNIGVRKAEEKPSKKLQDEIRVVQDVETAMENALGKLDGQQPSKSEEKELKKELSVMKDIERDLVSKGNAIKETIDVADAEADDNNSYETNSEDGYSDQDEEYNNEDYESSDSDYEYTDNDDDDYADEDDYYRHRRSVDNFRHRKPQRKESFRVDYVKHKPKGLSVAEQKNPDELKESNSILDEETSKISQDVNRAEKLFEEAEKLQREASAVQDVESVMADELENLKKHHPSKATTAEARELQKELDVMKELESDLVTRKKATEQEMKEVENVIENESDQSYDTEIEDQDEDYDQEQSEYDEDYDSEDYDYSYDTNQPISKDRRKRLVPRKTKVTQHTIVGVVELRPTALKHVNFLKNKNFDHKKTKFLPIPPIPGLKFGRKHLKKTVKNLKQRQNKTKPPLQPVKVVDALLRTLPGNSAKKVDSAANNSVKQLEAKVLKLVTKAKVSGLSTQESIKLRAEIVSLIAKEKMVTQQLLRNKLKQWNKFGWKQTYTPGWKKRQSEIKKRNLLTKKLQQTLINLNKSLGHKKTRRSAENDTVTFNSSELQESMPLTHFMRLRRYSRDVNDNDKLATEEQQLKDKINVVQTVENDMEAELDELSKHRPSKLVCSQKKTLQHELDTLNQVESDLMSREEAIEKKIEEQNSNTDDEDYDQWFEDDGFDDTEVGDYEDEEDETDSTVENYIYDDEDQEGVYRPKRNAHFRSYLDKLCEKKMRTAPKKQTKFWINFCKGRKKNRSKKPSRKTTHASKKHQYQKYHPTSKKITKATHVKKKHHIHKPHEKSSKPTQQVPQLTYSGGRNERCQRCEQKVGEEVCGSNGKTYNSLCHAVNCAGLSENDVNAGPCSGKDVCRKNDCTKNQLCVPMTNGVCLATYQKGKPEKLPCRRYLCVTKSRECTSSEFSQVCGINGKTYPSLCFLHKAGVQMAYTGVCRPELCKGVVCGQDETTYKSSCHARARNVRIDYSGECFAEKLDIDLTSCSDVRKAGRCVDAPCRNSVIPEGACCPVCGGAAVIQPDYSALASLAENWEEVNHLYIVENFLRKLLTSTASKKCELTSTLTDSGNISIVLAAVNPEEHKTCSDGVMELVKTINKHPASIKNSMIGPVAKTAAIVNPFNPGASLQSYLSNMQNKAIQKGKDSMKQANYKYKSTLKGLDDKATAIENQRELERENGGSKVSLKLSILSLALILASLV